MVEVSSTALECILKDTNYLVRVCCPPLAFSFGENYFVTSPTRVLGSMDAGIVIHLTHIFINSLCKTPATVDYCILVVFYSYI